jgi:hypothetical protein
VVLEYRVEIRAAVPLSVSARVVKREDKGREGQNAAWNRWHVSLLGSKSELAATTDLESGVRIIDIIKLWRRQSRRFRQSNISRVLTDPPSIHVITTI